jgi:hypothetical protein
MRRLANHEWTRKSRKVSDRVELSKPAAQTVLNDQ